MLDVVSHFYFLPDCIPRGFHCLPPSRPQNGLPLRSQQAQQGPHPSLMSSNPSGFDPSFFNLDASQAAKQMAALSAASNARMANSRSASVGGTSSGSYLGGITSGMHSTVSHDQPVSAGGHSNFQMPNSQPPNSANAPFLDPTMSNPAAPRSGPSSAQYRQRHQGFLAGLANIMAKRNTPLPPALTGIPTPNYDPNTSQFKMIEPSPTETGCFRLAGRDIDLFKLWGLTIQQGGGSVVCPRADVPSPQCSSATDWKPWYLGCNRVPIRFAGRSAPASCKRHHVKRSCPSGMLYAYSGTL